METELYSAHPRMFRTNPVKFAADCLVMIICLVGSIVILSKQQRPSLLLLLGGVLVVVFLIVAWIHVTWWLVSLSTTLTITDKRTILRKGIFSKFTNEVLHENVRNIQIFQTFLQRMLNVGSVGISSAGQSGIEIEAEGIPDPYEIKKLIDQYRISEKPTDID